MRSPRRQPERAGHVHGATGLVVGWILPGSGPGALWLMLPALITSAGVGVLLGLAALAVQSVIGPRPDDATTERGEL